MTGHIFIYGEIGVGQGKVSINNIKAQIDTKANDYVVHIISGGGDVFEGYGIYNLIKNTGKNVVTHVEGLCASIATLIAFAGNKIIMNKTGEFMIHNPKIADLHGDSTDIRNVANQLDKIKTLLIDVSGQRAQRNGKSITNEKLWELYDSETWLTSQEALNMGFVDEVVESIKAVAKVNLTTLNHMEQSKLEQMFSKITNLFKATRYKNQVTDTLEDGRVIVIMTETEEWVNAQVMLEDGSPLSAGNYTLASGKTITVDENYIITAVGEGAPANNDNDMNNKIKELEDKLAEALAVNKTATAQTATAEAKTIKYEARVKTLEQDFLKLKEEMNKTFGDTSEPDKGPVIKNIFLTDDPAREYDPMGEDMIKHFKGRNRITA